MLKLAESEEIDPKFAERLISNGLYPLQVSLAKAEQRLKYYKKDDLWLYCHLVGTNTLVAGYAYLGQNPPALQKDLEKSIYLFQIRLLDSIAYMSTKSGLPIPWDRIPSLVKVDGVNELVELYNSIANNSVNEQKNIKIRATKNAFQLFIDALKSIQDGKVEIKQSDLSFTSDLLYKLENMFTWSELQKDRLYISLEKDEWLTLSSILTFAITKIRPNTKENAHWVKQITSQIMQEVSTE